MRLECLQQPGSILRGSALGQALVGLVSSESFVKMRKEKVGEQVKGQTHSDFPGGPMVKNPPVNAGTQVQPLVWEESICHKATRPTAPEAWAPRARALQQEEPAQWEA